MSVNGLRGLAAAGALMALAATSAAREFESFGSAYRYARQRQSERDAEYLAGQAARKSKDKMQIKPGWRKVRRISSIWLTLTRG